MESNKEAWGQFFERYCDQQIMDLSLEYPTERSVWVDFDKLENYNSDIAQELLATPDVVLEHATEALGEMQLPIDIDLSTAIVRVRNLPALTRIKDIRSAHINRLVAVTGLVRKATEVRPMLVNGAFRCPRCSEITFVKQEEYFVEPVECDNETCGRKAHFTLINEQSDFKDFQKIRIQDSPDDLMPGEQPQTLDAMTTEDLTGLITPGDRAVFVGILRSYQRQTHLGKSTAFDLLLDTISIEIEEKGFEEIELTDDDEVKIKELASDPTIYNKIIGSIAPSIYGYDEVKEGIALQLFAGLAKELPDKLRTRGDIHVLLVGDPGVAKSQLLRYSLSIAPRGIFTNGRGSTVAGLTATATKDHEFSNDRWTLEAGALVLADQGIVYVDELDKMGEAERSAMHEAMAQQTVSVNKAGINTTLKARCSVLGAANPKFGRFDRYAPIGKQIDLPPALLSRFDLIFVIKDEPSAIQDAAVSSHILNTHVAGEMALRRKHVKNSGITEEQVDVAMEVIKPVLEQSILRKYIAYAKKTIYPLLRQDAKQRLNDFYLGLRKLGEQPDAPLPTTARQLEALIRLAEASARTRLSDEITILDAERVIAITKSSLDQVIKDPETGELDSDLINTGVGKSQRDRIRLIKGTITTLQGSNGGTVPLELIMQTLEAEGIKRGQTEDALKRMKTAGDIIEMSTDRYRVA
jgi:replicative DNA helicase Mcm